MRLVITEGTRGVWARLEPETAEEMLALEACDAQGEWTSGRGEDAITTLRALAVRLGYPVEIAERRAPSTSPQRLIVVKRGESDLYERLTVMAEGATVIWDRRQSERRITDRPAAVDRRRWNRRQSMPTTWATLGFLVTRLQSSPP